MLLTSNCWTRKCKHFLGIKQDNKKEETERYVCKAFPDRIPPEISYGDNLHTDPFPGDNGIQYEKE